MNNPLIRVSEGAAKALPCKYFAEKFAAGVKI
jgi:hypothetical protein